MTERYRNCTVDAAGSPVIVVLARKLGAASIHVLPPSVEYCHSYDARCAAGGATTSAMPEVAPGLAAKMRGGCTTVWSSGLPVKKMIAALFSASASAHFPCRWDARSRLRSGGEGET